MSSSLEVRLQSLFLSTISLRVIRSPCWICNELYCRGSSTNAPPAPGGTAGCIIAARLAETSPNLSILVIEGGANNKDVPHIVHPVLYLANLQPATKTATFHKCNKAPQLADREPSVIAGGVLGGGSSINFMMYTRPLRSDYDNWKMEGWAADDLLPYMKKVGLLFHLS